MITERPAGDRERNLALLKRLSGVIRNKNNRRITADEALKDIEQIIREAAQAEERRKADAMMEEE
jgi:hypothetical protein